MHFVAQTLSEYFFVFANRFYELAGEFWVTLLRTYLKCMLVRSDVVESLCKQMMNDRL